ncbi:MAG: Nif3-like dinuclear metal center hexameric protein [Myxococcales bacterium]
MAPLNELSRFLDTFLRIHDVPDEPGAVNGLQLDAGADVVRIACAVDASEAAVDEAIAQSAQLLLVHHGLLWGGNRPLTGTHGRKLRKCFGAGLSVYGAHIPLDVHPEVGNNVGLVRALGLTAGGTFAPYKGIDIGLWSACDHSLATLMQKLEDAVGPVKALGAGPDRIRRVGVVTGSGGSFVSAAARAGLDALITGEGPHHTAIDAEERGLHLLMGGHYRTETYGVKSLGELLAKQFGLSTVFVGRDSGL